MLKFTKLDQYQDNGGDIVLRFYFGDLSLGHEHWLKLRNGDAVLSLSIDNNSYYNPKPFLPDPEEMRKIIAQSLELVGGFDDFKKLIKNGTPTRIGINLAIADNTGNLQWLGKSVAQPATA